MATQMIDGFGKIHLRNPSLGLFAGGFAAVELTGTTKKVDARRFSTAGLLQISDSRISETTYELKVSQETFDTRTFELSLNELAAVTDDNDYYDFFEATVPATSPYEVAAPSGVTFDANSAVMVTMFENGPWNLATSNYKSLRLPTNGTSTPAAYTVYVDTTNNKLVFNAAQAGAPIVCSYHAQVDGKLTLGVSPTAVIATSFEFTAELVSDAFPNGLILYCPQCAKTSAFSIKSADVAVIDHVFTVTTKAGKRREFEIIQL